MNAFTPTPRKVALIMGVANQRSIAMSCMESFLEKGDWDVILTMQNEKTKAKVQKMIEQQHAQSQQTIINNNNIQHDINNNGYNHTRGKILGDFVCDISDPRSTELFFRESLPETLQSEENNNAELQAVIHSIAFAPDLRKPLLETSREAFLEAHEISAYSLIQVARETLPYFGGNRQEGVEGDDNTSSCSRSSITTLSYLGADRAIPGYHAMGPAKASLESIVRGLALELGQHRPTEDAPIVRVNAVRAGPIPTLSSKGGIAGFGRMREDVRLKAPLGNVSASQVASTVYHLAAEATGMTGQTIDVDGGYSTVGGPIP
jgi:enoyl-[acyl-carrier protein] reductase I